MESEMIALASANEEASWFICLLVQIPLWEKPMPTVLIHCDSITTIEKIEKSRFIYGRCYDFHNRLCSTYFGPGGTNTEPVCSSVPLKYRNAYTCAIPLEPCRYIACICYFGGGYTGTVENLHYREAPVADLCLDFTLPGYPDYTLKPGDEIVDLNNLEDYISMVVDATAKTGITRQLEAFRAGFNQVFDVSSLQIFTPHELDYLLCGRRELWKTETLADHIKFDHGYTAKSPAIVNLLEIMGGFTPEQQRALCQFVTGAPKLPLGGLAVLNPKLTIVRKLSSTAVNTSYNGIVHSESADDDLPSVKACAPLEPNNSLDQSL
ncbi:E3 ubiquitin-protein ligase UPL3 [Lathyrus oleraceus]|uniref:E3 ubiquitin-protein ligase UPL3 n=1 Tax=Pisum sativum TaxID=3888 RepID=UPI0021CFE370|nr:E3 ubiquitin-protein ligase UPL3-like [Pisum sativum]